MAMVPSLPGLQNEINRLFDTLVSRMGETSGETLSDWAPRVDVLEDADHLRIFADLPGLSRNDIQLSVERNTLTVTGVRKPVEGTEKQSWHRAERQYGTYKRVFNLPTVVDPDKVGAEYRDGVLEITLPKAEHAKPRMIAVKSE
jgi:HSP20 family protein